MKYHGWKIWRGMDNMIYVRKLKPKVEDITPFYSMKETHKFIDRQNKNELEEQNE